MVLLFKKVTSANICLSGVKKWPYYFYKDTGIDSNTSDSREQDQWKVLFSVCSLHLFIYLFILDLQWVDYSAVNELGNHSSVDTDLPAMFRNHQKTVSLWYGHTQVLKCSFGSLWHGHSGSGSVDRWSCRCLYSLCTVTNSSLSTMHGLWELLLSVTWQFWGLAIT